MSTDYPNVLDFNPVDLHTGAADPHPGHFEPANANIQAHVAAAHAPANAQKNSDITKAEIEAKLTGEISSHTHAASEGASLDAIYPVGCIYTTTVSTNPETVFGFGTWAAFGAGRCLVGLDAGQTEFDTAEETGGAKTVTLTAAQSGLPQHTHTQDAHTHTQNAHSHVLTELRDATTGGATTNIALTADTSSTLGTKVTSSTAAVNQNATAVNQNTGPTDAAQAHNNLQPYIVVYFFKRTA